MKSRELKGAITVYLSIILSAVLMFSGVLIDIARIRTAQIQLRRAVQTAMLSTLAGFHSELKDDYGLYALHNSNTSRLTKAFQEGLERNLTIGGETASSIIVDNKIKTEKFSNLYDYRIESIEVIPIYNFTENEITRHQILEYMKYRAPAQLAEDFTDKINHVRNAGEEADLYKQKMRIEKKLGKIEKSLTKLQKHINELNKFDKAAFSTGSRGDLMQFIEFSLQKDAYVLCLSNRQIDTANVEDHKHLKQLQYFLQEQSINSGQKAEQAYESMCNQVAQMQALLQEAQKELTSIEVLTKAVREDIQKLKAFIAEKDLQAGQRPQTHRQIGSTLERDIAKYEQLLKGEKSQSLMSIVQQNHFTLITLSTALSTMQSWISSRTLELKAPLEQLTAEAMSTSSSIDLENSAAYRDMRQELQNSKETANISSIVGKWTNIPNIVLSKGSGKTGDIRKSVAEKAKHASEQPGGQSKDKKIEDITVLPSFRVNGNYPNKIVSNETDSKQHWENEIDAPPVENMDFEEDSSFAEDTFGYIAALGKRLGEVAIDVRDEVYINEYILHIFKDEVDIEEDVTDGKSIKGFFEKAEVEYILTGNASESVNMKLVKGKIFLIRLGMNTLHVYSDQSKRMQTLEMATATAGITGFGIPIVHNLMMCAWGALEAIQDMTDIYEGKKVAFIKDEKSWKTDLISSGRNGNQGEETKPGILDFDYHDYLRLLLLVQNKDVKMNRVEDLIELNMKEKDKAFRLNGCNTYMNIKVQVSVRYWFMTRIVAPSRLKTSDGRHILYFEAWRGY